MSRPDPDYVKPAVLALDFAMDVTVSLANNCKTTSSPNVGSAPCKANGPGGNCTTIGS